MVLLLEVIVLRNMLRGFAVGSKRPKKNYLLQKVMVLRNMLRGFAIVKNRSQKWVERFCSLK